MLTILDILDQLEQLQPLQVLDLLDVGALLELQLMQRCMLPRPRVDLQEVLIANPILYHIERRQEGISLNLYSPLGPFKPNQLRVIVINVDARVILRRNVESLPTWLICIRNFKSFVFNPARITTFKPLTLHPLPMMLRVL